MKGSLICNRVLNLDTHWLTAMTLISLEYDQGTKTASLANLKGNHVFKPHYVISVHFFFFYYVLYLNGPHRHSHFGKGDFSIC